MYLDYHHLSAKVKRDACLLPRIDESCDVLGDAKYFSTIDLASAYYQVEVAPGNLHKIAFTTPFVFLEYNRILFSLGGASVTSSLM